MFCQEFYDLALIGRIDRVEAHGESLDMGRRKGLADEIAGLEDDDRVEDELAELKAKINTTESSTAEKTTTEKTTKAAKENKEDRHRCHNRTLYQPKRCCNLSVLL